MKLAMCVAAAGAGALAAGSAFADISYSHDFQSGVAGPEWSHQMVETAPLGGQRFLGQFGNEVVTLTLPGVNTGDMVNLAFDFLAIRTWDGNGTHGPGPDIFTVAVGGGPVLLASTFSVGDPNSAHRMSYPSPIGMGSAPSRTGAIANDTLGYTYGPNNFPLDATWRLSFTFTAPTDGLVISFAGSGLQELSDESWGIDNVEVNTVVVPAPGALALAGLGLGVVCGRRRR